MNEFRLLIGGTLVDGDLSMNIINPATEEVLARCPRASPHQVNAAVRAAKMAFPQWAEPPSPNGNACCWRWPIGSNCMLMNLAVC